MLKLVLWGHLTSLQGICHKKKIYIQLSICLSIYLNTYRHTHTHTQSPDCGPARRLLRRRVSHSVEVYQDGHLLPSFMWQRGDYKGVNTPFFAAGFVQT